ncbi:MAG: hypothetical protein K9M11_02295 [Candidatus Pacebacteria bacterium]|nr:hypothetical protein [Candidatus Paceibacterota bacterium]
MEKQTCKKCKSENIIMVQYVPGTPDAYDGVSEILCNDCKVRIGRWSGKELADRETEPKYGVKKK